MIREKAQQKDISAQEKDKVYRKMEKLMEVKDFLSEFGDFINQEKWDERFEIPYETFIEMIVDVNLKIFMGMHIKQVNELHEK